MMKKLVLLVAVGMMMAFSSFAFAAGVVDVVQSPTDYFVPTDAQKYDSPYYRSAGEDWGWTHGAIGGAITSATLNISAFDVDYENWDTSRWPIGERDKIYAYDGGVKTLLGVLAGGNDIWSYTTFTLSSAFYDDIAAGLQVFMEIDTSDESWVVSLAKSALEVNGGELPNPNPQVPEPLTMLLLGLGLTGIAGARRFTK